MVIQYVWGVSYEVSGDYEKAIDAFEKNPFYKDSKAHLKKCQELLNKQKEEARKAAQKAAEDRELHRFSAVKGISEGLACVEKDGRIGFIDMTGKLVIPCQYDWPNSFSEGLVVANFSEGLVAAKKYGKMGFIDKTGKEVIPFQYEGAEPFSEGFAVVKKNEKYGFVDKTGKEVIPCQYKLASSFSEGLAAVWKDGKRRFIDKTGR